MGSYDSRALTRKNAFVADLDVLTPMSMEMFTQQ
jgi:hypothetical protein